MCTKTYIVSDGNWLTKHNFRITKNYNYPDTCLLFKLVTTAANWKLPLIIH